jgi:hypothetical protein
MLVDRLNINFWMAKVLKMTSVAAHLQSVNVKMKYGLLKCDKKWRGVV